MLGRVRAVLSRVAHGVEMSEADRQLRWPGRRQQSIFDRYLTTRLLRIYGVVVLSIVGTLWLVRVLNVLDFYLSIGAGFGEAVQLCLLLLPTLIGYAVSPALMIAMLVFYANILNSREYYVLTSVGVSPSRLFMPVLSVAGIAMLITAMVHFYLAPWANQRLREEGANIKERVTLDFVKPRKFMDLVDGITVYTDRVLETGALSNVLIFDGRDDQKEISYLAEQAILQSDLDGNHRFVLTRGKIDSISATRRETLDFDRYEFPLTARKAEPLDLSRTSPSNLTVHQLIGQLSAAVVERQAQLRARLFQMIGELLMPLMLAAIVVAGLTGGELRRRGYAMRLAATCAIAVGVFAGLISLSTRIGAETLHYSWAFIYPALVITLAIVYFFRQAERPPV